MKIDIGYIMRATFKEDGKSLVTLTNKEDFTEEDMKEIPKETDYTGTYNSSSINFNKSKETDIELSITVYGFVFDEEKEKIKEMYKRWRDIMGHELEYHSRPHIFTRPLNELIASIDSFLDKVEPLDISKYHSIYDLFDNDTDYPEDTALLNGVPIGENFSYVSTTYLNGFINYVSIFHAIMIRRYQPLEPDGQDKGWEEACKFAIEKVDSVHSNITESCEMDDVLILAESDDSYWLFWADCDCSDSCIGRLDKRYYKKEDLIELLHRTVPNIGNNNEEYIVLPKFRGWITL